jgi:hypothetical protein
MKRLALVLLAGTALVTSGAGGPAFSAPSAETSSPNPTAVPTVTPVTVGKDAWVAVSVATLWRSTSSVRVVDRPALTNPVGIRAWVANMTLTDKRGLVGRADTQALLGDRVIVTASSGSWVKVVVPDQPTPSDSRGYPGWVPTAQLTGVPFRRSPDCPICGPDVPASASTVRA